MEGGFAGRTSKLVDGCYSFWQGGAFPILADLLRQQQAGRSAGGGAQGAAAELRAAAAAARPAAAAGPGAVGAGAAASDAAVALRLSKLLLGEAGEASDSEASPRAGSPGREPSLAEWVGDLPKLAPLAAVQRRQAELQAQLDAAVEASLDAEERYQAAAGQAAGGPLQQEALAALDRAAELQKVRARGCSGASRGGWGGDEGLRSDAAGAAACCCCCGGAGSLAVLSNKCFQACSRPQAASLIVDPSLPLLPSHRS